jgi:prepilin-type N-terminal cleavage/methylation domain-containing protein
MPLSRFGHGFTLVEVVVAIFVIGVMIVASTALLRGASASRVTLDQGVALSIAQNKIEALRAGGYAALPASGSFTDTALGALTSGAGTVTIATYDSTTKRVDVTVSWVGKDAVSRNITLTTLLTQTGGLQ